MSSFGKVTQPLLEAAKVCRQSRVDTAPLLVLAYYGLAERPVWASSYTIADTLGVDSSNVRRTLRRYVDIGVLELVGVRHRSNCYQLTSRVMVTLDQGHGDPRSRVMVTLKQTTEQTTEQKSMAKPKRVRPWPSVDPDVQATIVENYCRVLEKCGSPAAPSQKALGVQEGLGRRHQMWEVDGIAHVLEAPDVWAWIEKQLVGPDGLPSCNPAWAWKSILDKLDHARVLRVKKQQAQSEADRREQEAQAGAEEASERVILERRAAAGDVDAMRALYGDAVADAFVKAMEADNG